MACARQLIELDVLQRTITEEAESLIKERYPFIAPSTSSGSQQSSSQPKELLVGGTEDAMWDDASMLGDGDYRDLISALYDNLPNSPSTPSENNQEFHDESSFSCDSQLIHLFLSPSGGNLDAIFNFVSDNLPPPPSSGGDEPPLVIGSGLSGSSQKSINDYSCADCEYSTRSRTQFWRHRKRTGHLGQVAAAEIRPESTKKATTYCCEFCPFETKTGFNMSRHVRRRHIGERSVRCPFCPKAFKDSDTLRVHLRFLHHSLNVAKPSSGISDSNISDAVASQTHCDRCDKRFKRVSDLRRHTRIVHDRERAFCCAHCDKRFSTGANVRRHGAANCCGARQRPSVGGGSAEEN